MVRDHLAGQQGVLTIGLGHRVQFSLLLLDAIGHLDRFGQS